MLLYLEIMLKLNDLDLCVTVDNVWLLRLVARRTLFWQEFSVTLGFGKLV